MTCSCSMMMFKFPEKEKIDLIMYNKNETDFISTQVKNLIEKKPYAAWQHLRYGYG